MQAQRRAANSACALQGKPSAEGFLQLWAAPVARSHRPPPRPGQVKALRRRGETTRLCWCRPL